MKKNGWGTRILCAGIGVMLLAGVWAIAVDYGSQSDPLITLSYVNDVLLPASRQEIDQKAAALQSEYETLLNNQSAALERSVDQKLRSLDPAADSALIQAIAQAAVEQMGGSSAQWTTLTLSAGQKLTLETGGQLVLRSGSGTCVSSLMDLSDATSLASGKALAVNHLYAAGVSGCGLTAGGSCTVLFSGKYSLS